MKTHPLQPVKPIPATRVRTVVVDDSPFMLRILAQTLEEAGDFDLVATATDACRALRHVSALTPELVLMDIHMPGLNGIEATRRMKQSEHAPVVILISSHITAGTQILAQQAGADGVVSKEANFRHRLMSALKKLYAPRGLLAPGKQSADR
jgi:CheY-like chemotaxis protein